MDRSLNLDHHQAQDKFPSMQYPYGNQWQTRYSIRKLPKASYGVLIYPIKSTRECSFVLVPASHLSPSLRNDMVESVFRNSVQPFCTFPQSWGQCDFTLVAILSLINAAGCCASDVLLRTFGALDWISHIVPAVIAGKYTCWA